MCIFVSKYRNAKLIVLWDKGPCNKEVTPAILTHVPLIHNWHPNTLHFLRVKLTYLASLLTAALTR